jgi:adenosylmethionine-8-amino-7-oxononanoate aminotransferase
MKHIINSQLICANYTKEYPMIERGEGIYLFDKAGKKYIDASGCTAAVTHIGHGNQEISRALYEQAQKLAVHPTHLFYNEELENYLSELCEFAPERFNHAWTISGGTEAVENAIKIAYQYQKSKGYQRNKVLARWGSYHGNSINVLDVGGLKARRDYYTDLMIGHYHVSPCLSYRKEEIMSEDQYEDLLIKEIESTIEQHPEIFCFLAEPIVGAALGAAGPTKNYFKRIKEICVEHDILLIADEVMTGFGRTGENFGMNHYGNYADILCCAKGISSGYFPLGAIIIHDHIFNTLEESGHPFYSGQTYSCIPLAAAVGHANLKYIKTHKLVDNAKIVGHYLKEKFKTLKAIECVGDVRGEGLFLGIEFVKDQKNKTIIDPAYLFNKKVEAKAFEEGLVTYGCRGTVDLSKGDHMLFAPPIILNKEEADLIFAGMEKAIKNAYSDFLKA